jgi:hypothetical protein
MFQAVGPSVPPQVIFIMSIPPIIPSEKCKPSGKPVGATALMCPHCGELSPRECFGLITKFGLIAVVLIPLASFLATFLT